MTITAWRLVKWKYRNEAFNGEGSFRFPNRWNTPGRRIAYVSEAQSLAALENIVHFEPGVEPQAYAFVPIEFDAKLVQPLTVTLPPNWSAMPTLTATIGNEWYDAGRSCVLSVPTALLPVGTNYLFNVTHSHFGRVKIGTPIPYSFDQRIEALSKPIKQ